MRTIKQVLLCKPSYFQVDYVINPLMKPFTVDKPKAMRQWEDLVAAYEAVGAQVHTIDQRPDVPDMVFATDQGIVKDGRVLLANFRHKQRAKERIYYRQWFRDHGYELRALSNVNFFEGGDARYFGDKLFVGTGFRANRDGCEELAKKLRVEVVPLKNVDPEFYHLDMAFLPLDDQVAFYYPPAFSEEAQTILQREVPELIEFTAAAAKGYAANSVISGKDVITQTDDQQFLAELKKRGFKTHHVDVSEFNKAGGGIRCLTLVLE